MALKVIGAGLGRTGTLSLKSALETLGFGPCYHMVEVFSHPDHLEKWEKAADGQLKDWEEIFAGYASAVDWPACGFYRSIMTRYPEAKVILTERDRDQWFASTQKTIFDGMEHMIQDPANPFARMIKKTVYRDMGGHIHDSARAIAKFWDHNEGVRRSVPLDRLLVYNVAQGWDPLCRFLGVPVPSSPFPRLNTREDFGKLRETMRARLPGAAKPA